MKCKTPLAMLLAVALIFASSVGLAAQASGAVSFYTNAGNVLRSEGFSDGYVWARATDKDYNDYYVCVDTNGRAVMMVSKDVSPDTPRRMENGYTYIEDGGDWQSRQVAVVDRDGRIISTFSSSANNYILAMGYGYIMAVETPNSSGFDMTAAGTCRYKLYDPRGQVVFEREYEGSANALPAHAQYYGGGVFALGNEFYFTQTGVTADLGGLDIRTFLSFYEGPWCLSVVQSEDAEVLLVVNTSGECWTEPIPYGWSMSRGLVWKDGETGDWYSYDVETKQWYTLGAYADRVREACASIGRIALTMKGDDGNDYFAIYDSQWNMISKEPTLGSVIDIWDGAVLVQTDTYNEQTILTMGDIINTSDKVMCIYDAETGLQRQGILYGNAVGHHDGSWGTNDNGLSVTSGGADFYITNGVICLDDSERQCYDTEGNFLFSATAVDFSGIRDLSGELPGVWAEDAGSGTALVLHAEPAAEEPGGTEQAAAQESYVEDWVLSGSGSPARAEMDAAARQTDDEHWYTQLGDCQTYYGALRDIDGEVFPAIRVLSYMGDMIEMRSDWLNYLNDYELEPSSQTETEWVYLGLARPDELTYYPEDGSIGIQEGERVDIYRPMLEHGTQYALPDGLAEDWYMGVGQTTYVAGGEYVEIGLMFTDGGDGSFTAMMLPVDEFSFRKDACEGTPAGGVYYAGDRAGLYYYPEYSTAFIVLPQGDVYEFSFS